MKKGFTLIELLAVIIILAIIALIATPIVLDVVDDAKDSVAMTEAKMVVDGVQKYCAAAEMKEQLTGVADTDCTDSTAVQTNIAKMVDLGNAKVNSITYDGKVTSLEVESNGRTVKYNGSTYTIDGEEVDTPEEPVTPPAPTYAAYSVGDEVTLSNGTTWVVVKDTPTSESEIKIMATSNVKANLTTETGTAMFTSTQSEYALAYDSNESNVWANSTLKTYLDGTVKTKLEDDLNTNISDITIWGAEELTALGCTVTGNDTKGYSKPTCDNTKAWYSKVLQNTYSWTKLRGTFNPFVYFFTSSGIGSHGAAEDSYYGARPVITISKSVISQ